MGPMLKLKNAPAMKKLLKLKNAKLKTKKKVMKKGKKLALAAPPSPAESEDASGLITPEKKPKAAPAFRGSGTSPKKATSTAILPYKESALAIPEGGVRVSERAKKEAKVTTRADGSKIKTKTVNKEQKTHSRSDGKHVETRTQQKERKLTSKADGTVTHSKSTTIKRISYKEA